MLRLHSPLYISVSPVRLLLLLLLFNEMQTTNLNII